MGPCQVIANVEKTSRSEKWRKCNENKESVYRVLGEEGGKRVSSENTRKKPSNRTTPLVEKKKKSLSRGKRKERALARPPKKNSHPVGTGEERGKEPKRRYNRDKKKRQRKHLPDQTERPGKQGAATKKKAPKSDGVKGCQRQKNLYHRPRRMRGIAILKLQKKAPDRPRQG